MKTEIKITKTFEQLKEIDSIVGNLYQKNPKLKDGKFGYAYNRFYAKNLKPIVDEINEKLTDSRIENAMVDATTKELLYDNSRGPEQKLFKYTKEGMIKFNNESRKIYQDYDKKEVEIIPYFTSDVPEMLDEQREELKGCLIK
jgi:hypothetical protein